MRFIARLFRFIGRLFITVWNLTAVAAAYFSAYHLYKAYLEINVFGFEYNALYTAMFTFMTAYLILFLIYFYKLTNNSNQRTNNYTATIVVCTDNTGKQSQERSNG